MVSSEEALKEFRETIPIFEVLADERRQQIMIELTKHAHGLTVGELTKIMHISQPAVSHQLKTLKDHHFVSVEHQGTRNFYHITFDAPLNKVEHLIHTLKADLELKPYLR
ncbi:helix-turn-helix transcriptional regulator [Lactiplantibacillus xiangfangensis]|uniref:Transcription regulator n=1 Tax=Lactiplantibacillus xiangfangensis TaxID=942150 RepID=A0A0R2MLY7_9LACO|nr:metalloregulator ArsR/SmtB family transcription factor [Lactiplantibacillus xiangfangensis]KRO14679.1 transcription regulator [Lactiplantibacillus xiangfangensis]